MTAQLEGSISSILAWLLTHCLKEVMLFTRKKERKEKSGSQTTVKTITSYYFLGSSSSFAYASQIKTWTLSSLHLELSQIDWRSSCPIIQCVRNFIYSAYVFLICQSNWLLWWFGVFCSDGAYGYDRSGAEWEGVVSWDITCPCLCAPDNFVFLLCCPQLTVPSSVLQQVLIFFCSECAMLVSIM